MTQLLPPIIRIKPTSARIAWVIAGGLALAALLYASNAWLTGSSSPTIYFLSSDYRLRSLGCWPYLRVLDRSSYIEVHFEIALGAAVA